jgi:hypothetical protein
MLTFDGPRSASTTKDLPLKVTSPLRDAILLVVLLGVSAGTAAGQDTLVNLTTGVTGSGLIVREPDQTFYEIGTTVSLTAIADDGFVFQAWSGPVADPASEQTTVLLKSNTLVGATFVPSSKPRLKTDPDAGTPLDFGTVETGLLSLAQVRTVTVTNVGGGTLEGTAVVRAGTSRPYGIVSGGSFSLAANESAEVQVVFDPFNVDLGSSFPINGDLDLISNGGNAEIPLTGVAIANSEFACQCATIRPGGPPWGDALVMVVLLGMLCLTRRRSTHAPI